MNIIARLFEPLYRWLTAYMGRQGMILYGIFDCDCACAAAPDYTPVANASKEAAEVMAQLGREQIDEARRQYDTNLAVSRPVVDVQLELMRQGIQQGTDYYEYGKTFRPLEQAMLSEVAKGTEGVNAAERQAILGKTAAQSQGLLSDAEAFSRQQTTDIEALRQQQEADAARQTQDATQFQARQDATAQKLAQTQQADAADQVSRTAAFEQSQAGRLADLQAQEVAAANRQAADARAYNLNQEGMANQLRDTTLANEAQLRGRTAAFESDLAGDIRLATGGRQAIFDRFRSDIDADVGNAVADARLGQTQALNTALRQAARYGLSVPSNAQTLTNQNSAALAAAANNTRTASIDAMRNVIRDGIGLKTNTFQVGQGALESAMNRGEGALANRIGYGRDNFMTSQAALSDADNRRLSSAMTGMNVNRDTFVTGSAARSDASNRSANALTSAYNMGRDTFATGQAAMADASNRRFAAGTSAIGQMGDVFRTSSAAKTLAYDRDLSALNANRNMRIQDQSLDFARKLDVTGMARGMPGASQGAYSVANQSGNSAVQNQMAPGNSYLSAVQGGIGAIGQGQQMRIGGLSNVLNAQTSFANSTNQAMNSGDGGMGGLGSVIGGVASLYSAGVFGSDRRIKENIELVGQDERTDLNLYEFSYIDDPEQRRFVGVMADEVVERFPDAVGRDAEGFMTVNYARLGIEMKEVA